MNEKDEKPEVSVVMSVWNDAKYLKASISSILEQTFKDFEFIIIDDFSTDASFKIIDEFRRKDDRIVLLKNDDNIGLTKSLNKGLGIAKGRYIARMDADDIALSERIKSQHAFLNKNKDVFLCGTHFDFIDLDGSKIKSDFRQLPCDHDSIAEALSKRNCFAHPTMMFRNENLLYRDKFYYSQDYDFVLTLLSKGKRFVNLEDKLLLFRKDVKEGISYSKRKQQRMFAKKARELYFQREKDGDDKYDDFSPENILKQKGKIKGDAIAVHDKIISCLKRSDFPRAKQIYKSEFKKIKNKKFIEVVAFFFFINFPISYKLYRKVFYEE